MQRVTTRSYIFIGEKPRSVNIASPERDRARAVTYAFKFTCRGGKNDSLLLVSLRIADTIDKQPVAFAMCIFTIFIYRPRFYFVNVVSILR